MESIISLISFIINRYSESNIDLTHKSDIEDQNYLITYTNPEQRHNYLYYWNTIDAVSIALLLIFALYVVYRGLKLLISVVSLTVKISVILLTVGITYSILIYSLDWTWIESSSIGFHIKEEINASRVIRLSKYIINNRRDIYGLINDMYKILTCKDNIIYNRIGESVIDFFPDR